MHTFILPYFANHLGPLELFRLLFVRAFLNLLHETIMFMTQVHFLALFFTKLLITFIPFH